MKRIAKSVGFLLLLLWGRGVRAQLQVGDELQMRMSGLATLGYEASYGDQLPSAHGLDVGGNAQINGSYYNPNFINFSVNPYYDQSRADSNFQSLTDSSGVIANVNFFTGSRFPGYASYDYTRNSTGTFGLTGGPNFTTVGNGQGFGVGWSALVPDWPTFSISYSQGNGNGTVFGTNEESSTSTKTLNLRSTYSVAGWHLGAQYQHLDIDSNFPSFLSDNLETNYSSSSGNSYSINGIHSLPWHGTVSLSFNRSSYSGNYGSLLDESTSSAGETNYTTDTETANLSFHPTDKLGLYFSQVFTDNLNGYLYQAIENNGGGVPVIQLASDADSSTISGAASYNFTKNLYGLAQITYYNQTYFGKSYEGSYVSGTVGYGKRIWDIFTFSGSIIESSNQFADSSLGFMGNLNAYKRFGAGWEFASGFSYAQNVQTLLVTYTTSYYNYNANLHKGLGRGRQWTGVVNGNHSGFSREAGTVNQSVGFSTSLALRFMALNANYIQGKGQSLLTSTGIQPINTPGLPPIGLIVYNGKSYGGGVTLTPIPRLTISGNYSYATSDTLSGTTYSVNKTNILFAQLQYRLRKINLLAGYTKFGQGISGSGSPSGNQYAYYVGVSRWFNFF